MKLVVAGGGTGGHLFPGIAVAEALQRIDPSSSILFVGTEKGIEKTAVPKAGFDVKFVEVGGLKRVGAVKALKTLVGLPLSVLAARRILREFGADAVLGVGGYASGPVVAAAWSMGLPTAIHEQNSVPGITNKALAKIAGRVYATFPSSTAFFPADKTELVGDPVRRAFVDAAARPAPPVERGLVFTFGGSQGARPLNEGAPQALAVLKARGRDVRALHQAGRSDVDAVKAAYVAGGVAAEVTPFIDDMVAAYRRAHVVVCRAGATSCAELTALGVPAILIPFPQAADDHQTKNAQDLVDAGAAVLLPQSQATPEALADAIDRLLSDDDARRRMSEAATRVGRLDAGERIARAALGGFASQRVLAARKQSRRSYIGEAA